MLDSTTNKSSFSGRLSWILPILLIILNTATLTSSFCPQLCSCNDNSLSVDCHGASNLRMVPIFLNPQTKFLSLANNQIKDISMSFQFYSELQSLDFSQNKISTIGENNFENLKNLLKLNASFNGLTRLESDVFLGLRSTRILDLSANHLEKIHGRTFRGLASLRELYLDRNRLDSLGWDLFQGLESLEILSAKYNFLRVLEPPTPGPGAAAALVISSAAGAGNPAVSPGIEPITTTTTTPAPPWTLRSVKKLDMSWNQITRIKDFGLSVFSGLLDLNLCCNYIHTVEERAFVPAPGGVLTRLNLSQNRLSKIPTESLEKLGPSLQELDLSSNRLTDSVPPHAFRSLFQLRLLRLSDNPGIAAMDPTALIDNVNLVSFQADHLSNLTAFPAGLFNNKPFLREFSLRFSAVPTLPEELLKNPQYSGQLSTLRLAGIPLDCNCSALSLFQYVTRGHVPEIRSNNSSSSSSILNFDLTLGQIQCVTPSHLQGSPLQELRLVDFEHCFEKVFFATEHFEILVIGLGALIVLIIGTVIGVKLCCVHGLCRKKEENEGHHRNRCCCRCCCPWNCSCNCKDKDEKDRGEGFCCSNGGAVGSMTDHDREYPTIVAAKKILQVNSDEFRAVAVGLPLPLPRGRFDTLHYSSTGSPSTNSPNTNNTSHSNHTNSSSCNSTPHSMTLLNGGNMNRGSPLDLDGYLHSHSKTHNGHGHGHGHGFGHSMTHGKSNKLRFDPKMQMPIPMHLVEQPGHHPPMILHYEYDYPDYRTGIVGRGGSIHRSVKQVPSVLV